MYIDEDKKFIFFHNPKCGGSTTVKLLNTQLENAWEKSFNFLHQHNVLVSFASNMLSIKGFDSYCVYDLNPLTIWEKEIFIGHCPISVLFRDYPHIIPVLKKYFKFCFIRNPYTLFYSMFLQHLAFPPQRYLEDGILPEFNIYAAKLSKSNYMFINSDYTHYDEKSMMDFIGKFENFEEDLKKICEIIDIPYIEAHYNKRGDNDYLKYYTSASIAKVNELYAKDFELFDYEMLDPKDFPDILPEIEMSQEITPQILGPEIITDSPSLTSQQIEIKNSFYFYRKFRMKIKISNLLNRVKQEYPNWDFI